MGKPWTKAEDAELRAMVRAGRSSKQIAEVQGRTPAAITNRAKKTGLVFYRFARQLRAPRSAMEWREIAVHQRILSRCRKDRDCLMFQGAKDGKGYGQIRAVGRTWPAHRLVLEVAIGRILASAEFALHSCDRPACCNENHLRVGSQKDNMQDAKKRGRMKESFRKGDPKIMGTANHSAKLTEELVIQIRRGDRSLGEWSRQLGISRTALSFARRRLTWKHVT